MLHNSTCVRYLDEIRRVQGGMAVDVCEVSRRAEPTETEGGVVVARGWGEELLFNEYRGNSFAR